MTKAWIRGLAATLFLCLAPAFALADTVTEGKVKYGDPEDGGSWLLTGWWLGAGSVDHAQFEITDKYTQEFVTPTGVAGFSADANDSWSQVSNDGTIAVAEGDADDFFLYQLHFDGDSYLTDSVQFYAEYYLDGTLVESYTIEWDHDGGANIWNKLSITRNSGSQMGGFVEGIPTPEPATLLLFGLGAAGFAWRRRRSAIESEVSS